MKITKGYNWCSFNIDGLYLSQLFTNITKSYELFNKTDNSDLIVYSQNGASIWQLEQNTIFGNIEASWSNDILISHSELYIIHSPFEFDLSLEHLNQIPKYLKTYINKDFQWVGYYGDDNRSIEDVFHLINENIEIDIVMNNVKYVRTNGIWNKSVKFFSGSGYIMNTKNLDVIQYQYENLEDVNAFTILTDIRTAGSVNPIVYEHKNHPNDTIYFNGVPNPILTLGNKVYKFVMNNISTLDGKTYPLYFLKNKDDIASLLDNYISGSDKSYISGIYYLDLRNYKFDVLYYRALNLVTKEILPE